MSPFRFVIGSDSNAVIGNSGCEMEHPFLQNSPVEHAESVVHCGCIEVMHKQVTKINK